MRPSQNQQSRCNLSPADQQNRQRNSGYQQNLKVQPFGRVEAGRLKLLHQLRHPLLPQVRNGMRVHRKAVRVQSGGGQARQQQQSIASRRHPGAFERRTGRHNRQRRQQRQESAMHIDPDDNDRDQNPEARRGPAPVLVDQPESDRQKQEREYVRPGQVMNGRGAGD